MRYPFRAVTGAVTVLCVVATLAVHAPAATATTRHFRTELVDVSSSGRQVSGFHGEPFWVSADGRFVAFTSGTPGLVPGDDPGGLWDVFVRDRRRGTMQRIVIASFDAHLAGSVSMSPTGRYLAFASEAPALVRGDTNGVSDVFLQDRWAGVTRRVSVSSAGRQADGPSYEASVSPSGRYVAFSSVATNLVPGDTNGFDDIFVRDLVKGTTTRINVSNAGVQGNRQASGPLISADGRYVAFSTMATNVVPDDRNRAWDAFVRDRRTGTTRQVNVSSTGVAGNGAGFARTMSPDGRWIGFDSRATNLVPGDTNGVSDVLLRDRRFGRTTQVSVSNGGAQARGESFSPSISANGRYVAFSSQASDLVSGDTNQVQDVFVRDRWRARTCRASVSSSGAQSDAESTSPRISSTGRHLAFLSNAGNLVPHDSPYTGDVFLRSAPC